MARLFNQLAPVIWIFMAGPGIECQQRVHVPGDIADTWKRRDPNRRWLTYLSARIYPEITSGRTSSKRNQECVITGAPCRETETPPAGGWRQVMGETRGWTGWASRVVVTEVDPPPGRTHVRLP